MVSNAKTESIIFFIMSGLEFFILLDDALEVLPKLAVAQQPDVGEPSSASFDIVMEI